MRPAPAMAFALLLFAPFHGVALKQSNNSLLLKAAVAEEIQQSSAGNPAPRGGFYVDDFKASSNESQFDVAKDAALAWIKANNAPNVLHLGNGVYDTCTGIQMPTSPVKVLNIVGISKGESGGGTVIRATCPMDALINFPALPKGQWWSNLVISHLTLDGNNQAQSCLDLNAPRISHLQDISCTNAIGPDHWVMIGNPNPPPGAQTTGFQVMVDDLFVFHNATGMTQQAQISPILHDGSITSYSINSGGVYRLSNTAPVLITGYGAGSQPCKVMPTGVLAHLAPGSDSHINHVTSITQATGGSDCSGAVYVHVPDLPAAEYGIKLGITDSTLSDLTVDSVGRIAAISNKIGGANTFIHAHAWQTPVLFQTSGNDNWMTPECDMPAHYCFDIEGPGSKIVNPIFYWMKSVDPAFKGSSGYYLGRSAYDVQIELEDCGTNLQNSGGYEHFVTSDGPLQIGEPEFEKRVTLLLGGHDCTSPASLPPSVTIDTPPIESALWGTLINGEQHNFSASTHDSDTVQAFRLAKLPPFDPHTKGDAAVSVRFMGGQIGNPRFTAHFILSNGSRGFTYEWTRMGSMASQSHAGIRAFAEPDGSISIYEFVGPGYGVGSSTIEFVQGPSTILYPRAQPMTPVGKQVFSSDDPKSYPTTAP